LDRAGGMHRGLSRSDNSRLIGGVLLHRPANRNRRRPRCDNHPYNRIGYCLVGSQARGPKYFLRQYIYHNWNEAAPINVPLRKEKRSIYG